MCVGAGQTADLNANAVRRTEKCNARRAATREAAAETLSGSIVVDRDERRAAAEEAAAETPSTFSSMMVDRDARRRAATVEAAAETLCGFMVVDRDARRAATVKAAAVTSFGSTMVQFALLRNLPTNESECFILST